jgi:hypothetical protein
MRTRGQTKEAGRADGEHLATVDAMNAGLIGVRHDEDAARAQ